MLIGYHELWNGFLRVCYSVFLLDEGEKSQAPSPFNLKNVVE